MTAEIHAGVHPPHNKSRKLLWLGLQHPENILLITGAGSNGSFSGRATEIPPDTEIHVSGPDPLHGMSHWKAVLTRSEKGAYFMDGRQVPGPPSA